MAEKGTKSNRYAAETIEAEGLGYAVQHYIDGHAFRDAETARLWTAAGVALDALEKYLRDEVGCLD